MASTERNDLLTAWSTINSLAQRSLLSGTLDGLFDQIWSRMPALPDTPQYVPCGTPELVIHTTTTTLPETPRVHVLVPSHQQVSAYFADNRTLCLRLPQTRSWSLIGYACYICSAIYPDNWTIVPFSVTCEPSRPVTLKRAAWELLSQPFLEHQTTYGVPTSVPSLFYLSNSKLRGKSIDLFFRTFDRMDSTEIVELAKLIHLEWKTSTNLTKQQVTYDVPAHYDAQQELWKVHLPLKWIQAQRIGSRLSARTFEQASWLFVGFVRYIEPNAVWMSFDKRLKPIKSFPLLRMHFDATRIFFMIHALLKAYSHTTWLFRQPQTRFELIVGPAKSGKTQVLVDRIRAEYARGKRMLVIASDPDAVDRLAVRLMDFVTVYCIHEWDRDVHAVDPRVLSVSPRNPHFTVPPHFEYMHRSASAKPSVWITTAFTSRILEKCGQVTKMKPFDVVVVDDASRLSLTETLIPLMLTCCEGARVWLSGDTKQIGPEFVPSLFQRVVSHPAVKRTELVHRYQAHPDLVRVISRLFYDNRIQPAQPTTQARYSNFSNLYLQFPFPIVVYAVERTSELPECVTELRNLAMQMYPALNVSVVAAATEQQEYLEQELATSVETVATLRAVDVLIICLKDAETDRLEMNTMLSSAAAMVFVVGHVSLFELPVSPWTPIVDLVKGRSGTYRKYRQRDCQDLQYLPYLPANFFE